MREFLRKCFVVSACASLILVCSCEEHHVGEDPEFQKEHTEAGSGSEENPAAATEAEQATVPTPTPKPTPPEFFPENTPH